MKIPKLFSDNMVLQRDIKVPVWGWAEPSGIVEVRFNGQTKETIVDKTGKWLIMLDPMRSGGPFEMMVSGEHEILFKNVMLGDVWVCGGQSNMALPLSAATNAKEEIAAANYPDIRLYSCPTFTTQLPLEDFPGKGKPWRACTPATVRGFSAVGYFFGRNLFQEFNIPIGLINSSCGGTAIELWMSKECLRKEPEAKPVIDIFEKACFKYPVGPVMLNKGQLLNGLFDALNGLYNGMINPIMPFAIKGVIWYQGEANAERAYPYRKLLPLMIKCWRENWGQGNFPFLLVQLANLGAPPAEPASVTRQSCWSELREAQLLAAENVSNCGMAVTIDVGEAGDLHPPNKQDVGARLAIAARKVAYGQDIVHSGPVYREMKKSGNKIILKFKNVGGGLVARGGRLKHFAIAAKDKNFVWADAVIQQNTVVVSSNMVNEPVAVRYAWAGNPEGCNLYNEESLPATPFRTDDWPGSKCL